MHLFLNNQNKCDLKAHHISAYTLSNLKPYMRVAGFHHIKLFLFYYVYLIKIKYARLSILPNDM